MGLFVLPEDTGAGWGPSGESSSSLPKYPIENINRYPPARVGKACDFTQATQDRIRQMQARDAAQGGNMQGRKQNTWAQQQQPLVVEDGYNLVDTKASARKKQNSGYAQRSRPNYQQMNQNAIKQQNYQEGILGKNAKTKPTDPKKAAAAKGKGKGKGKGFNNRRGMQAPTFRDWSVPVKNDWETLVEFPLTGFVKMGLDARQVKAEDLVWCGKLYHVSKAFDRVNFRQAKQLPVANDVNFYNPTTTQDETIEALMTDDSSIEVAGTDHILACLMAAGRSVYSWDVLVQKIGNKLIFDKRDGAPCDFTTVNETAQEPPSYNPEDKDSINAPPKLSREAARVNQNFSECVVDRKIDPEEHEPHPFGDDEEEEVSAICYRYRKFTLPGDKKSPDPLRQQDVAMVVRAEVSGKTASQYVSAKCLNYFEAKNSTITWRQHLEAQPGAVLANELKNNSFKLGRWVAQAILAGCEQIKLGYAMRQRESDPMLHELVCVQAQPTNQLASQISLSLNNAFGILRHIIDTLRDQEDGSFIFLKDPNKPILRLYSVPDGCFDPMTTHKEEIQVAVRSTSSLVVLSSQ
ncbi:unnamed protein product [Amoebophrya sp. A120]|nr:unnamed protein product [Amoebophrya sp. A120]|eukprot:GSA120T00015690001.1